MNRGHVTSAMAFRAPESTKDHQWLVELHNDPAVLRNLTNPQPITMASHLEWWARVSASPTERRYLFTVNEERVGFVKFYSIDWDNCCCVLGADIHQEHRGKGYARPMWSMMLDEAFGAFKMHRVGLSTAEYNYVGQRVYRSLGFKEEGRLVQSLYRDGRYHDQILMYMLKTDWAVPE